MRISTNSLTSNSLTNIFKNSERLQSAHIQLSSGKKLNKPSDDPVGQSKALSFHTKISAIEKYFNNIDEAKSWVGLSETALDDIGTQLQRSKELAMSQSSGTATASTRQSYAIEMDNIISQIIQSGNTKLGNRYIFAGRKTDTTPFSSSGYAGDNGNISVTIDTNINVNINIPGLEILAADLDPGVNSNTSLSVLNKNRGVSTGSFSITDRSGSSATITVSSGMTLGNVINNINSSGLRVSASLNNTGITLTDTVTSPTGNLKITEVGSGTTASDLGILGERAGGLVGLDLDPSVTSSTPISLLKGGNGLTLNNIQIVNGTLSGTITLSSLTSSNTISDILTRINSSGTNVTASISSNGNTLTLSSNNPSTVPVTKEVGSGTTASDLGLQGEVNIISTLTAFKNALNNNDPIAIRELLESIDKGLENILKVRSRIGALMTRLEDKTKSLEKIKIENISLLSNIEDTDIEKVATDFISFKNAYESSLAATAQIVRISLLDFLK